MKFSKRERFLICLLLLVVLWTLALKFDLGPGYEKLMQTREDLLELKGEKASMDLYLKQFSRLEEEFKEMSGGEEEEFLYRDIDDAFMDQHLQDIAGRSGIEVVRMGIGEPVPVEANEDARDSWTEGHVIMETAVTMEVDSPGVEQIKKLADEVYREPTSLFISYIDLKTEDGEGTGSPSEKAGGSGLKGIVEVRFYYEKTE